MHLFLGLLWAQLALALLPSWNDGTYYSYGSLVFAAVAGFYLLRRREFSEHSVPLREDTADLDIGWFFGIVFAGLLLIAFARLLQGANPHWRLPLWSQGLLVLGLTAWVWRRTEGPAATRFYLPAPLLLLVAIPLPSALELALVQTLTQAVVAVSSDLARAFGIPLQVIDTAFLVRGQPLDVNDQCSGIRSFQSSLAVSLLVGELLRLTAPSRLLLVVLGAAASFLGNTGRVLALVHAFFTGGADGLEARHDVAGLISQVSIYGLILALGFVLERCLAPPAEGSREPPPGAQTAASPTEPQASPVASPPPRPSEPSDRKPTPNP